MDFLVINKNKIKVKVSKADMKEMDVDFCASEPCDVKMRRSLWRLMDIANTECGFNTSGARLLLQFYKTAEGSEIFITKIGKSSVRIERSVAKTQNAAMLCSRRILCRIYDVSALIKLFRNLPQESLEIAAELYYCQETGGLYLIYDDRFVGEINDLDRIFEFSVQIPAVVEPYIREHSIKIIDSENAIRVLSEL